MTIYDLNKILVNRDEEIIIKNEKFNRQIVVDVLNDNYLDLLKSKDFERNLYNLIIKRSGMKEFYKEEIICCQ